MKTCLRAFCEMIFFRAELQFFHSEECKKLLLLLASLGFQKTSFFFPEKEVTFPLYSDTIHFRPTIYSRANFNSLQKFSKPTDSNANHFFLVFCILRFFFSINPPRIQKRGWNFSTESSHDLQLQELESYVSIDCVRSTSASLTNCSPAQEQTTHTKSAHNVQQSLSYTLLKKECWL